VRRAEVFGDCRPETVVTVHYLTVFHCGIIFHYHFRGHRRRRSESHIGSTSEPFCVDYYYYKVRELRRDPNQKLMTACLPSAQIRRCECVATQITFSMRPKFTCIGLIYHPDSTWLQGCLCGLRNDFLHARPTAANGGGADADRSVSESIDIK
jgi:hypothetical protein